MTNRAELFKLARAMYPHYTYLAKYKKADLEKLLNQNCKNRNDFRKWENNSCYIDSMLFVIMLLDQPGILMKLRDNLSAPQKKIAEKLRGYILEKQEISSIRSLLQKFKGSIQIDWLEEQQEPMDLWRTLEEMFVMFKTKTLIKQIDGETQMLIDENNIVVDTAIQPITPNMKKLSLTQKTSTTHPPTNLFRNKYKKRKEVVTITKAKFLIFHISRRDFDDTKLTNVIDAPMRMRPKENTKPLYLRAVIVHHGSGLGGHYTVIYECKGCWWEYDDMKANIKRIGLSLPLYVLENSTDYFYW